MSGVSQRSSRDDDDTISKARTPGRRSSAASSAIARFSVPMGKLAAGARATTSTTSVSRCPEAGMTWSAYQRMVMSRLPMMK